MARYKFYIVLYCIVAKKYTKTIHFILTVDAKYSSFFRTGLRFDAQERGLDLEAAQIGLEGLAN
jgi:hypothetical protein